MTGGRMKKHLLQPRALRLGITVAFLTLCLVLTAVLAQPSSAATDKLPDLGMTRFEKFTIQTVGTQRQLRFAAIIVNIGVGAFDTRGSRPDTTTTDMTVVQRIYDTAGGYREIPSAATMYYAGDGH